MRVLRCPQSLRLTLAILLGFWAGACGANQPPATMPAADDAAAAREGKLPHVQVDLKKRQVRVECQMLGIDAPLEFLCVLNGTNEHESVLRSPARPSHIHLGLVMLGLDPGEPVHFSEAAKKWFPPSGPPLNISVEFTDKAGKPQSMPASRLMRSIHDKKSQPPHTWIFAGSKVMPDGNYAADVTGYTVSVVNFELSLIDIPDLASNANETLEWEIDKSVAPPSGSPVTMVIEPVAAPATRPAPAATESSSIDIPTIKISDNGALMLGNRALSMDELKQNLQRRRSERPLTVRLAAQKPDEPLVRNLQDELKRMDIQYEMVPPNDWPADARSNGPRSQIDIDQLRARWQQAVAPHRNEMREAAQAHYDVILQLRREQQKLVDQADQIQRLIDDLERQYQQMTTPQPQLAPAPQPGQPGEGGS
jgi:hypothetical protein